MTTSGATPNEHRPPRWFTQRRFGMFVHANIATVPAFSPVHEYADWYWSHLEPRDDVALHPTSPLPEVMAWHAENWPGYSFDDFIPHLTFERFDAADYAGLATAAGMRYVVMVTKHHDGFCWWDTALTDRNAVSRGPHRDVVSELADAARSSGLVFGTYYSLLDWSHPAYPDQVGYVDEFMRPQLAELTERYRPSVLWGDGHWGHPAAHWRSDEIVESYFAAAERLGIDAAVNDRFFASHADFRTYEYEVPETVPTGPWELCRGMGHSFCFNRVEEDDDHLTAAQVVALLAEVVAKGGNLLLNIGPKADGTIPDIQARVLREAGAWVRAHDDAIHGSTPFAVPGGGSTWYTVTPDPGAARGSADGGLLRVNAIDLASAAEPHFAALSPASGRVAAVTGDDGDPVVFRQSDDGLHLGAGPRGASLAAVYRIALEPAAGPIRLRVDGGPGRITRGGAELETLGAALDGACSGDVVELAAGRYGVPGEVFPMSVPAGVTVRAAPGVERTDVVVDGGGQAVFRLSGDAATLSGLTIAGGAPGYFLFPPTCVLGSGYDRLTVRDCHVQSVSMSGGEGHVIAGNVVVGGNIGLTSCNRVTVTENVQRDLRWGAGIEIVGGGDHVVQGNECSEDLCAIRLVNTSGARIEGNHYETRWFGIHVKHSTGAVVRANQARRTMRGVGVEGGAGNLVESNLAWRCDTGALIERDATATRVVGNRFDRCRIGVLTWDDERTVLSGNEIVAPREHRVVSNVVLDSDDDEETFHVTWERPTP